MKKSDLLSPLAFLYGAIARARRTLYEKGILKTEDLGILTVSIGNLTVGGTGKTPLVAFVAALLAEKGEKVCVLSRGYRRIDENRRVVVSDGEKILASVAQSGDEPFELAHKLLGAAAVVADADRTAAGKWARQNLNTTAFVLDDAFGHLKVKRDLDIVCIDATNAFGNGKLLPAGILREPPESLKRADAIVITRANLVDEGKIADLKSEILRFNQKAKIFVSKNKTSNLVNLNNFHANPPDAPVTTKKLITHHSPVTTYMAFCALGNPESFFEQLRRESFNIRSDQTFPDHHFYTPQDVEKLEKTAAADGAQILLTTAKDAVKLRELKFTMPCLVVESELIFDDENFRDLILNLKLKVRS